MAKLILEVQARGLNQYHRLEHFPVNIGRALDNDIILSDGTVSPYHIRLEQKDNGQLLLHTLSDENGTRLNGHTLKQNPVALTLPAALLLGNRSVRLLSSDMPVEDTQVSRCSGLFLVLCHPIAVTLLFVMMIFSMVANDYIGTTLQKEPLYYLSNLLLKLLILLPGLLVGTVVARMFTNRWQFWPVLGLVSLFGLLPLVLSEVGHWIDYWLTSDVPSYWLVIGIGNFLLLPLLIFVYSRWIIHQRIWPAIGIALLLSALPLGIRAMNVLDQMTMDSEFSGDPSYSHTLSAMNMHSSSTLSLNEFLDKATAALPTQMPANKP